MRSCKGSDRGKKGGVSVGWKRLKAASYLKKGWPVRGKKNSFR